MYHNPVPCRSSGMALGYKYNATQDAFDAGFWLKYSPICIYLIFYTNRTKKTDYQSK